MPNYEERSIFNQVMNTALSLMESRGKVNLCQWLNQAEVSVINTDYDNWNGGTYGYSVTLYLPVTIYGAIPKERIEELEREYAELFNEVIKDDNQNYFIVRIAPRLMNADIDWSLIGGEVGKQQLRSDLDAMKDVMISVATGGARIESVDARYKSLQLSISQKCKLLKVQYNNGFATLWEWYGRWSNNLPTYRERREYISDLLAPTFEAIDSCGIDPDFALPIIDLNDWGRINRTVVKIKRDSTIARNEEDFQQIGFLCREVIISLAQTVYNPIIHGSLDDSGLEIGKSDSVRMIGNYLNVRLAGSSNEELRSYAKATNKLANMLTHKRDATKSDMLMSVAATIALISFIRILEDKGE